MHSTLVRVQNVFGFFTSVAFAVAAAIAVSVLLSPQNPSATLELKNVRVVKGRPHYYSTKREEYAHVTFDLDADLSSLFNWNTKQVFAYITASYPSDNPQNVPDSEVVVWDAIIPSDSAPVHQNTYIHPTTTTTTTGKDGKNKKKSKKTFTKKERALGLAGKAYPEGTGPGIVRLQDQKPKYQITDVSGKMAERPFATLTLHWNVQPWVGLLTWTHFESTPRGGEGGGGGGGGRWWSSWCWWQHGLQGGISDVFNFPAVKEAVKKDELKTETGGESNRGKPA